MWMKEEDIVCEEIYWEILFIFSEVFGLVLGVLVGSLLDMKLEKLVFCLYLIFGWGIQVFNEFSFVSFVFYLLWILKFVVEIKQ